jgi:SAM-dependent methyltransferase
MSKSARFDQFSDSYENLLRDPIRERFTGAESAFFHLRKRDLIRDFFRRHAIETASLTYLDVGCGKGELVTALAADFLCARGCDVSAEMMRGIHGIETRVQDDPMKIPFTDGSVDFVTAVCVYHHVPPVSRAAFTSEIARVLKPDGLFAIIEHNPFNPATRLIVSRTPVDADAILLRATETGRLLRDAGLVISEQRYFLYLPERIYRYTGALEDLLRNVPLGGQYAVFARRR